jgi:hypothetical protein
VALLRRFRSVVPILRLAGSLVKRFFASSLLLYKAAGCLVLPQRFPLWHKAAWVSSPDCDFLPVLKFAKISVVGQTKKGPDQGRPRYPSPA